MMIGFSITVMTTLSGMAGLGEKNDPNKRGRFIWNTNQTKKAYQLCLFIGFIRVTGLRRRGRSNSSLCR